MASIELVSINGYTAFEDVSVRVAFNEAARSFSAKLAAELGASATSRVFDVGTEVTITFNGETVLTGYVDAKEPHIAAKEAYITISGRSKSADLIDSSGKHKTGYFENKDPVEIGKAISEGIEAQFETDQQLEKIEQYKLQQGESCFRCVEKLARQQGLTIFGTAEGNAKLTKAGSKRQGGSLIEGVNIKSGTAHHNGANRHSSIIVRGQRPFGHGDENLQIEAKEQDGAVKRYRPLIIVQDEDTDKKRATKRAKNRKNRAAGNALKATIVVQGFHDDGGQLWEAGNLVWTESPFLDLAQDMLIESIDFNQSDGGSIATLNLVDPRAHGGGGSEGSGNKSGSEWSFPSDTSQPTDI
jgi:prophage tail gpP-like protein